MTASLLVPSKCVLGESPVWHDTRKSCLWVDIEECILYELEWASKKIRHWDIKRRVSVILENNEENLVLGVQGGLMKFNFKDGNLDWLTDIESEINNNRCNDGACDSQGRIWVGIMDRHCKESAGSLYCVDADLQVNKMIEDLTIPNGLVWSLDNERMYFIDSPSRKITSYLFNKHTGKINFEKVAVHIPKEMGVPDGMAIDETGMLWVAMYGGYCVARWNPENGKLLNYIRLPVPNITNCCFVGDNLDNLMITTARENLSTEELLSYPESGSVFIVENMNVKGVKSFKTIH